MPVATDLAAAPDDILKAVHCRFRSSRLLCGTKTCACFQHGLKCVAACKHCNGQTCENAAQFVANDNDEDDDDDEILITVDNFEDIPYECFISDIPWIEEVIIENNETEESVSVEFHAIPHECIIPVIPWIEEEVVEDEVTT